MTTSRDQDGSNVNGKNEGDDNLVFYYNKFMRCKPVPFKGGQELVVNLRWLRQMEMVLESCGCPEDKKVMIASRNLKESALNWWNCKKVALGTEYISRMIWSSFSKMFEAKYCTPRDMDVIEKEFLMLKKDGKLIDDYVTAFYEKLQFCAHLCPDVATTIARFIGGLPIEYHELCKTKSDMNNVVEEATRIEDDLRVKADEHKDFGLKRKSSVISEVSKKFKSDSTNKAGDDKEFVPWCSSCKAIHKGACSERTRRCDKCGKQGHVAPNCKDKTRCYRYGSDDHKIAYCPKKKGEEMKDNNS